MRIVLPSDVDARETDIGPKTRNLRRMSTAGLPVPEFVAIPADTVRAILKDPTIGASVSQETISALPADRYAVRSSAIAEDSKARSFAGQFTTVLDRSPEQLAESIRAVIADAATKGHGDRFSVLVQRYVPAAYAGVAFTRAPEGGRHMHIEYHRGIGEGVVSGSVKPTVLRIPWTTKPPRTPLPNAEEGIERFKAIERLFGFAQDIEWCIDADGRWHILQARPLTTIDEKAYAACLFLDDALPKETAFLYEKTEVSEIAPRPTTVTLDLLRRIYAHGGPAARAYESFGVRYTAADFLRIVGNELYVDREVEVKTLLPSFSRFASPDMRPRFVTLAGFAATFRNSGALAKIDPGRERPRVVAMLRERFAKRADADSLRGAIDAFLEGYADVVRVNILAAKALAALERSLGSRGAATALSSSPDHAEEFPHPTDTAIAGNALELADDTPFFRSAKKKTGGKDAVADPLLDTAAFYADARECGRLLTVTLVTMLRTAVLRRAEELSITKNDAYFCTLQELLDGAANPDLAAKRKDVYEKGSAYTFPARLSHAHPPTDGDAPTGVSAGVAEGTLVTLDTIDSTGKQKILHVETLSPSLTARFGDVVGIVSEQGGLLSHLAIVAREQGLPVVVGFRPGGSAPSVGERVRIDGSTGTVERAPAKAS